MKKPTGPCLCGANDWRQLPDDSWTCNRCHPLPKTVYSPEVMALLERVRQGNDKLWNAWKVIRDIQDPEEREAQFKRWDTKVEFLNKLCLELTVKGYNDCLYIENGKKTWNCLNNPDEPEWWCNTCPAGMGGGPKYWEQELMALPGFHVRRSEQGAEQAEFLKKLGGKEG